ncbi:MAG: hypothetical protein ABJF11_07980 [Reichenbachiella sp.]|uniref:hypothetical protein n=1 Tax=Reichenbachiella sp. TaxID=2184521 RepID=UPI0032632E70
MPSTALYGQKKVLKAKPKAKMDTVRVKADRFIFIHDHAYYVRKDSVFILPDTTDFYIRKNNLERTQEFYKQVEKKMSKSKVASLMYGVMFANNGSSPRAEEFHEQAFTPYERDKISSLKYKHLPIFGATVKDTTKNNPSKWTKPLNKIHVHTQDWIIRKNLTFKEGDRVDPSDLVDSERLLRRLDYVKDARIMIRQGSTRRKVDVAVVTQDVFPYSLLLTPSNDNDALFGLSNVNIAGIGHELEYDYIRNGGSDFFYRIINIQGSFIDSELNYANHFRRTGIGGFLSRDFYTQETKYAGGAALSRYKYGEYNYEPASDVASPYFYEKKYASLWLGRSFKTNIKTHLLGINAETNAVASAGVEHSDFYDRPIVTADTNYRYHDNTTYLLSLGLSSRNYYKDRFIVQFGRTEDIPTGSELGVVAGYQTTEFNERVYIGFNYARGGYIRKFGYLNGIVSWGSFLSENGYENGIFRIGADYFTSLINVNQYKIRQFVDLTFSQALHPDEEYILSSEDHLGIRGVRSYYLRATTKLNLRLETVLFTPINLIEFRMALFGFFDYTMTKNIRNNFFDTDHFLGLGGGIRLRNDNLAVSTIQIRLGYYPSTPINAGTGLVDLSTSSHLNIRDFAFRKPEIIPF